MRLLCLTLVTALSACTSGSKPLGHNPTPSVLAELPMRELSSRDRHRVAEERAATRAVVQAVRLSAQEGRIAANGDGRIELGQDAEGRIRIGSIRTTYDATSNWKARFAFDTAGRTATIDLDATRRVPDHCGAVGDNVSTMGRVVLNTRGEVVATESFMSPVAAPDNPACQGSLSDISVRAHAEVSSLLGALGISPDALDWTPVRRPAPVD